MQEEEIWVQVPTKSGRYYFSNYGRAKRIAYDQIWSAGKIQHHPEKMLKILPLSSATVSIEGKPRSLAKLVAEEFVPNPNKYKTLYHKDGNKLNCHADNIAWGRPERVILDELKEGETERDYILRMYEITTDGRIYRKSDNVELTGAKEVKGYLTVRLKVPPFSKHWDRRKPYKIHRLVAMKYLSDYSDDLQVNHINGIKTDNRIENLEMVTNQENVIHAYKVLDSTYRRQAIGEKNKLQGKRIMCIQTGEIYLSAADAARKLNLPYTSIYENSVGKGASNRLNGFTFKRISYGEN